VHHLTATRPTIVDHTDGRPVATGVDAQHAGSSALLWAIAEAESTGRPLRLVTACEPLVATVGLGEDVVTDPDLRTAREHLAEISDRYLSADRPAEAEVLIGRAVQVLLDASHHAHQIVLGQRGAGMVRRLITGSTSIAVAGRAACPVVVVPTTWSAPTAVTAPVVVGLDLRLDDLLALDGALDDHPHLARAATALDAAADQAERRRVPLLVVCAWEPPAELGLTPREVADHEARHREALEQFVLAWRDAYPGVEIALRLESRTAEAALTAHAATAQLLVVGRRTAPMRAGGFALGSSTRHLLHHLVCPVMVVP